MADALAGLLVIELGSTVAGPFCARLLADFGARVVKVEDPQGDALRSMGAQVDGRSLYAASLLRNKEMIAIDLRSEAGRSAARRLIARCDILVENFRPGVMESWGMAYEDLAADNPGLVMVRISGFGQTGPYSQRAGYGVIGEAVSGLRSMIGDPDRPPARVGIALTDYITGLYAAFGALAALQERRRSGRGQLVDAALSECAFSLMEGFVPAYAMLGEVPRRAGARLPGAAPNNLYPCRDRDVHIAAFADSVFRRLCSVIGQPGLANDARFRTGRLRARHADEIDSVVSEWTRQHDSATVERDLNAVGVPAARIFSLDDIFCDPHFEQRGMLLRTQDPRLGELTLAAPVPRLGRTPAKVHHPGRPVGADTVTVLSELAGLSSSEIAALFRDGAPVHNEHPNRWSPE